eukprot:TRINITY_DN9506_c1_g1_i1.p2 TRINITY_DN9506_c1_g1~~TRINITY_DN9506_c1_g1_i1.p2  ORF type:complete len:114 (-),score=72.49 TRINITY_DN9506_c1_g1_i1:167-508(-)
MSQQGIQQLLQAEKKAEDIISQARRERTALLKRARDEADAEIHDFKGKRSAEFEKFSNQYMGDKDSYTNGLKKKTDQEIVEITRASEAHRQEVVDLLLKFVSEVDLTVVKSYE